MRSTIPAPPASPTGGGERADPPPMPWRIGPEPAIGPFWVWDGGPAPWRIGPEPLVPPVTGVPTGPDAGGPPWRIGPEPVVPPVTSIVTGLDAGGPAWRIGPAPLVPFIGAMASFGASGAGGSIVTGRETPAESLTLTRPA